MGKTCILAEQIGTIIESHDETNFIIERLSFFVRVLQEIETHLIFIKNSIGATADQLELIKEKYRTIAPNYQALRSGEHIPIVPVQDSVNYLDKHLLLEAIDLFERNINVSPNKDVLFSRLEDEMLYIKRLVSLIPLLIS